MLSAHRDLPAVIDFVKAFKLAVRSNTLQLSRHGLAIAVLALARASCAMLVNKAIENDNVTVISVLLNNNVNSNWFPVKVLSLADHPKSGACLEFLLLHPILSRIRWKKGAFSLAVINNNLTDCGIAMLLLEMAGGDSLIDNGVPLECALTARHFALAAHLRRITPLSTLDAHVVIFLLALLDKEHFLLAFSTLVNREVFAGKCLQVAARGNQVATIKHLLGHYAGRISWHDRLTAAKSALECFQIDSLDALLDDWEDQPEGDLLSLSTNAMQVFSKSGEEMFASFMSNMSRPKVRKLLQVFCSRVIRIEQTACMILMCSWLIDGDCKNDCSPSVRMDRQIDILQVHGV
ncbi:hypothetical protein HDU76_013163 [Blyttiomyces sp. JEL0837]|nr:hypothetical protein HDU76_013163 [Blyttiomyces sp. JEL0837]